MTIFPRTLSQINVTNVEERTQIVRTLLAKVKIENKTFFHSTNFDSKVSILHKSIKANCTFDRLKFILCFSSRVLSVKEFQLLWMAKNKSVQKCDHAARFVYEQILRRKFTLCVFVFSERKWNTTDVRSPALFLRAHTHIHECVTFCDKRHPIYVWVNTIHGWSARFVWVCLGTIVTIRNFSKISR